MLARTSSREALPTAAEREIEFELWRATQIATGEAENVRASLCLLDNADTAHNIAMGRFKSSVGSALEMLSAQNAFARNSSATQAEITALPTHIRLGLASGRMQLAKKVQAVGTKKNGLLQRSPSTCHNACRVMPMPGW